MSQAPQTAPKKNEAAEKMKALGGKLQAFAKKAADSTKNFVKETEEEIKMTESMTGLIAMATKEFQTHIKQKADTTDKNAKTKELFDSFQFRDPFSFFFLLFFVRFFFLFRFVLLSAR